MVEILPFFSSGKALQITCPFTESEAWEDAVGLAAATDEGRVAVGLAWFLACEEDG